MDLEIKRQIVHASGILTILLIQLFGKWVASVLVLLIVLFLFFLAQYRKNRDKLKLFRIKALDEFEEYLEEEIKAYERPNESMKGAITFFTGCLIVIVLFSPSIAIPAIVILSLSDALSTIIGKFYGKHKLSINKNKTWEGSLTFLITTFLILLIFTNPLNALAIGIITTFVEMLPKIDDNISVPLVVGILMFLV
ncbi:MAG: diacylglycerol/polyprenol kinase family protein [Candidatus Aenigmatarchaeota archaeon]